MAAILNMDISFSIMQQSSSFYRLTQKLYFLEIRTQNLHTTHRYKALLILYFILLLAKIKLDLDLHVVAQMINIIFGKISLFISIIIINFITLKMI